MRFSEQSESVLDKKFGVLDKGYVKAISYHGTDEMIEAAARVSYAKGTRKVSDTAKLIKYLMRHKHMSPFEMGSITYEIKLPMFVLGHFVRHRTAKLNVQSYRYSEICEDFYRVDEDAWRLQSDNNKQSSYGNLDVFVGGEHTGRQRNIHEDWLREYDDRITDGICREQARIDTPMSVYTKMYWQADVRNLLGFLLLRCDKKAQLETQQYANVIGCIAKQMFPLTFDAWEKYHYNSITFSRQELQDYMTDKSSLNEKKYKELQEKLELKPFDFNINNLTEVTYD